MAPELKTPAPSSGLLAQLNSLRSDLGERIQGQAHALDRVCSVLVRGELGMANLSRPRGTFLFVGPTGVGKTELTNIFTGRLFSGAKPLRFDMSEYQLQKSVDRLLGENSSDSGLLGRMLRGVAQGTLLFDEIEKAHPLVLDLLLQILEDARVTLTTGEVLDLHGFYIVCTSNIGSAETMRMENAPFASVERTVLMRVREQLRPELVGRVNDIVVFARLTYPVQRQICEGMIAAESARLAGLGHRIEVGSDAVEFLVRQGYHRMLGARPMRGAIERYLQEAVTNCALTGQSTTGVVKVSPHCDRLLLVKSD